MDILAELRKVEEGLEAEWANMTTEKREAESKKGSAIKRPTGGFLDWEPGSY